MNNITKWYFYQKYIYSQNESTSTKNTWSNLDVELKARLANFLNVRLTCKL